MLLLSVTVTVAVRVPGAVGVKVTVIVQLPLPATEPPQLFVWPKSPALVPLNAMPLMVNAVLPVLFKVTVCPALVEPTFWLVKVKLEAVNAAVGALPVPVKLTNCGLVLALSLIVIVADLAPDAVGEKVTVILQLLPADTGLPHVLLWAKSPALVPVTTTELTVSVAFPVLFTVTPCEALVVPTDCPEKVRLEAVRLTAGPDPVPVRPMVCGLVEALSTALTEAVRVPTPVGVNVTVMVQSTPAAREAGHVLVSEKSPALAPVTDMPDIARAVLPMLVNVTDCEALVTPTVWLAKVRLGGEMLTAGPEPVPVRLALCVLPATLLLLSVTVKVAVRGPGADGLKVTLIVQLLLAATDEPQVLV